MVQKIKDLTTDEFKELNSTTIQQIVDEAVEDILALSSPDFIDSIKRARQERKEGKVKKPEELVDVYRR